MLWLIIGLAVFSFVLVLILGHQDEKNASLTAENKLMKERLPLLVMRVFNRATISHNCKTTTIL